MFWFATDSIHDTFQTQCLPFPLPLPRPLLLSYQDVNVLEAFTDQAGSVDDVT